MKSTRKFGIRLAIAMAFMGVYWSVTMLAQAQAAASRFVGSITAISGTTITVKTDAGEQKQVEVPSDAVLKQIAPGQKDLSTAATIEFGSLAVGDRVLVKLNPDAAGSTPQAAQIIAVKQADLAQKQQHDREEWQRHGVGGLVKSVDAASGNVVVTSGAGANAKSVTVQISKTTVLKRYASDSVSYDQAQVAPIDAIHPGDQLRARGEKNADGTEIKADEVVSGSFRNIAGTISSMDAGASTLVVKDLATKKQVTVRVAADAQMKRLPEQEAQRLANRLKGGAGASGGGGNLRPASGTASGTPAAGGPPSGPPAGGPPPNAAGGQSPSDSRAGGGSRGAWSQAGGANGNGGNDPQQMLNRAPAIKISDLQKGEAVMLVATEGTSGVTAITLLAGVEPLLEAPVASQNLLSNWSMGGGGGAEAGAQ